MLELEHGLLGKRGLVEVESLGDALAVMNKMYARGSGAWGVLRCDGAVVRMIRFGKLRKVPD